MRPLILVASFSCFACPASFAGQIILLRSGEDSPIYEQQLKLTTRFYGIEIHTITLQDKSDSAYAIAWLSKPDTLAAAITSKALAILPRHKILIAARRPDKKNIPLLIVGVAPEVDSRQLLAWSNGAISACQTLSPGMSVKTYIVGTKNDVTRQLAGQEIPAISLASCSLVVRTASVDVLISVRRDDHSEPIFVRTPVSSGGIFFLPAAESAAFAQPPGLSLSRVFSEVAPMMMFVRYAFGDRAWHSVGHYANLSIDDAWLIEPYGHLDYEALLGQMTRHNFHTTIAFIPWNYDRSRPNVVELFRKHGDHFSICIHGNNHNHQEFGDYTTVSLDKQVANLQQAVARMQKFTELTGIPYDRVMVFPHATAAEAVLAQLKNYGFLATAYSLDLPSGAGRPTDPLFFLRSFNLEFANFPGLNRYSAEVGTASSELATQAFLDNPILFYGHQRVFDGGITAFNKLADTVNTLQPGIRWCSLGCVAQHLYLVRLRDDGNFDTEVFSSNIILENQSSSGKLFLVRKAETSSPPVKSVMVEGVPQPFIRSGDYLILSVFVPGGQSREMRIEYSNDWDLAETDISRRNLHVALLRYASDFRDLTLSRLPLGRALTRFYYDRGLESIEMKIESTALVVAIVLLFGGFVAGARYARRYLRRTGLHRGAANANSSPR